MMEAYNRKRRVRKGGNARQGARERGMTPATTGLIDTPARAAYLSIVAVHSFLAHPAPHPRFPCSAP